MLKHAGSVSIPDPEMRAHHDAPTTLRLGPYVLSSVECLQPAGYLPGMCLARMFHTGFLQMGGTGYQPVPVGNLPTRLGRARCRDEAMRSEKLDVVLPPGCSPAERAGCPCHPTPLKHSALRLGWANGARRLRRLGVAQAQ